MNAETVTELVSGERARLRLLQLAALTSTCDRFSIAPLLVVIGIDLHVPLSAVAGVASAYYLAYGLMQLGWGIVSDRIGRVRAMRFALLGATLAGIGSALAPDIATLGVTRAIAGGCFAAIIPSTLVYVGDVWPAGVRQRQLSDVLAASTLGITAATVGAGVLAAVLGWRAVPALTALAAAALWFALAKLPEPEREPAANTPLRSVRRVVTSRWGLLVLIVVLAEGAVVLGALTYIAPAVQTLGFSAAIAGLVAAAFGIGAMGCTRIVRSLVGRRTPATLAAIGGALLVAGWLVPALTVNLVTVSVAGLLLGGGWAFLHSTLQAWATEVVPEERAAAVALFATALFLGSAAGTAAAAPLAESGAFGIMFGIATLGAVPVAIAAAIGRRRYAARRA